MNAKHESGASEWIDSDDAPELTDEFFETATYEKGGVEIPRPKVGRPRSATPKIHTRLRIDPDVLNYYRASGAGWQTRINAILREAMNKGAA